MDFWPEEIVSDLILKYNRGDSTVEVELTDYFTSMFNYIYNKKYNIYQDLVGDWRNEAIWRMLQKSSLWNQTLGKSYSYFYMIAFNSIRYCIRRYLTKRTKRYDLINLMKERQIDLNLEQTLPSIPTFDWDSMWERAKEKCGGNKRLLKQYQMVYDDWSINGEFNRDKKTGGFRRLLKENKDYIYGQKWHY